MFIKLLKALVLIFVIISLTNLAEGGEKMKISSPQFKNNDFIPKKFTCMGINVSPELVIENIPEAAKTLALIVDDPDAPSGTWIHWVVYNMAPLSRIAENTIPGKQGINDFGKYNYGGPCPPSGTHRYFFKLYALDKELNLAEGVSAEALLEAMQGHMLDSTELIGLFKK
jgi:Raf kinase inhibitor-like YbhB/YbcL family protein